MKKLATLLALVCPLVFASYTASAQQPAAPTATPAINSATYHTAIGLRGGMASGLTIKHFTGANAVEGIIGFWRNGMRVTVLLERHVSAGLTPGLMWYYGLGAHGAVHTGPWYRYGPEGPYTYRDGEVGIGVDAIVGLEYKIPPIPFAVSLDLKPMLEVTTDGGFFGGFGPGLGIKFTF